MFKTVFAFGDSLSDAGNDYYHRRTHRSPSLPITMDISAMGRLGSRTFSKKLGLGTLTPSLAGGHDFAFGGAGDWPDRH